MKKYLILLCAIFLITACDNRLSNDALALEVIIGLEENNSLPSDVSIDSLIVTRDSPDSNKYTGTLKTSGPNGPFTYVLEITYDGESFAWEEKR